MARLSKRQIQRRAASQKARELSKTKARNNNQGASEQEISNNDAEIIESVPVKEEEDVIVSICIICCCPAPKNKYPTRVKFLLGQVVPYSLLCDSPYRQEEIEQHIDLCSSCVRLLGQGEQLHERIVKLERELDQVKNNVKKLVQNSTLVKQEDGGNLVVEQIYGNIREQLLSDFVGGEDGNFHWSGIEFDENEQQMENIYTPEIGDDPLEFGEASVANSNANSALSFRADSLASSNPLSLSLEEDYRNFPEFERDKVVTTYSKSTHKRSVKPLQISQLMKRKHKEKKYAPKTTIERRRENVTKTPIVKRPRSSSSKTGSLITDTSLSLFSESLTLPVLEVRKLPDLTTPSKGSHPCVICPDKLDTLVEAALHRKFIHPGFSLCTSPVRTLQCGKIFRSCDIKRHRIESHPLVRCPECRESFTTTDRLESHMKAVHYRDGSELPPLPEFGYDVKLIPWMLPLTTEEIREVTRDQGFFYINLKRLEIKETPEHVVAEQSIGKNVEEVPIPSFPSTSISNLTDESNQEHEILNRRKVSVAKNISTTENARVFPTELTQPVPVKRKRKKIIYNCGVCNTKFPVQSDLLQHLADAHNQTPKFGCFVCLKEFTSLSECEAHVLSDHPDAKLPETPMRYKSPKTTKVTESGQDKRWMWPFMCKTCRLRFKSLPALQTHLKSEDHTLNLELGPLEICPRDGCKHEYRGQAELDSHLAKHDQLDNQIKCPQCYFRFADSNLLLHHRVRCHKYVPTEAESLQPIVHPCQVENCGKLFNHKEPLARHMASMHGIGKHMCEQCGKVFSQLLKTASG
ncbi:uncharacterized protein LOC110861576 isoform X2 [Folsomia candida]|uniref:uncharacterized protein LOC110861576 isoform X2 n=1 Tax=Folsomia candida TaxID=158441 RepID=UPI000B901557|nr:uncharacterized protein LOC110861576 isoform X2 [Folsomia candida]